MMNDPFSNIPGNYNGLHDSEYIAIVIKPIHKRFGELVKPVLNQGLKKFSIDGKDTTDSEFISYTNPSGFKNVLILYRKDPMLDKYIANVKAKQAELKEIFYGGNSYHFKMKQLALLELMPEDSDIGKNLDKAIDFTGLYEILRFRNAIRRARIIGQDYWNNQMLKFLPESN